MDKIKNFVLFLSKDKTFLQSLHKTLYTLPFDQFAVDKSHVCETLLGAPGSSLSVDVVCDLFCIMTMFVDTEEYKDFVNTIGVKLLEMDKASQTFKSDMRAFTLFYINEMEMFLSKMFGLEENPLDDSHDDVECLCEYIHQFHLDKITYHGETIDDEMYYDWAFKKNFN